VTFCLNLPGSLLVLAATIAAGTASAQPMLYAQRLPEGTVYIRLASALPAAAIVTTDFAGTVSLGNAEANRISPYFVAGSAGGKTVALKVAEGSKTATATIQPKSGTFITVVLHEKGNAVVGSIITDKPEYNQLKARMTFYNATDDCSTGSLSQGTRAVFPAVAADGVQAASLNPVSATVIAACGGDKAKPLDLGALEAGGLYSVWMMRLGGQLTSFMAHDTIAPPRS
jgi:alginate O-acetyltransferase complex protein AlgF